MPKPRKKKQSSSAPRKAQSPSHRKTGRRWGSLFIKLSALALVVLAGWCIFLDATVRDKFDGKRWQLPAQVFARPLEIYVAQPLSREELIGELAELGYQRQQYPSRPGTFAAGSYAVEVRTRTFQFADGEQTSLFFRAEFEDGEVARLLDENGGDLAWARLEPVKIAGIYPAQQEDRILLNLEQVPDLLEATLVQVEDRRFYEHFGISPASIARAMLANIKAGRVVQGGSTLTQQLVKNFYLSSEQSLWRKANEAIMSLLLEWHYEKADILEAYINEIYLGQAGSRGIHGFGMASQFYFGKSAQDLQPEQIALLVAIVKGASYYNPRRHPERARERRNLVLQQMADAGLISAQEGKLYAQRALGVIPRPRYGGSNYPAFMDLVKRQLGRDYREEDLQSEGLRIFTTLDPRIQKLAEQSLAQTIRSKSGKSSDLQGALISTSVSSGEVTALVGDRQTDFSGFNRALSARRQIGSLIKPVVMLTALGQPENYTLATVLRDEPFKLTFENGDEWIPRNYDGEANGSVILQRVLAESLNLATARLGLELGVESVLATVNTLGVETQTPPYPSILLGALNLTPLEVTTLYQNLISTGFRTPLRAIRAVTRPDGELLSRYTYDTEQVIDPAVAYIGQFAMFEVMRNGTGRSVYQQFPEDYHVGGKTGTTDDYRDSWFVGFNGQYLTTVWLGNDDNSPTGLTGASGALAVWKQLYRSLPQIPFAPSAPERVEWAWVDRRSGLLSAEHCEGAVALPFVLGSVPEQRADCVDRGNFFQRWLRQWWDE